jgi:hypothetical protein
MKHLYWQDWPRVAALDCNDLSAIREMADRLDGKPAQEQATAHVSLNVLDMTDQQIAERIAELRGAEAADGVVAPPIHPKKLN